MLCPVKRLDRRRVIRVSVPERRFVVQQVAAAEIFIGLMDHVASLALVGFETSGAIATLDPVEEIGDFRRQRGRGSGERHQAQYEQRNLPHPPTPFLPT